jgi:hypothetical protein
MKRFATKLFVPLFVVYGLSVAGPAHAAIVLVDTLVATSTVDGVSYTIDGSTLDFTSAAKLVVTVGAEGTSANFALPPAIDSITYGGVPLGVAAATSNPRSNVWYVDLANQTPVGTNFQLEFVTGGENSRGYYFSAYTLAGTAAGVSSAGESGALSITNLNPPTAGEFLVASFSRNAGNQWPTIVTSGLTLLNETSLEGQYTSASIYGTLASAGAQQIEILDTHTNSAGKTVIATFAAIPEPSSLAMLAFGAIGLWLFRKKKV